MAATPQAASSSSSSKWPSAAPPDGQQMILSISVGNYLDWATHEGGSTTPHKDLDPSLFWRTPLITDEDVKDNLVRVLSRMIPEDPHNYIFGDLDLGAATEEKAQDQSLKRPVEKISIYVVSTNSDQLTKLQKVFGAIPSNFVILESDNFSTKDIKGFVRDRELFAQSDESYLGECPICCLPLPLDSMKSTVNQCCCKRICDGCDYANKIREFEAGLEHKCPYCREPVPADDEEIDRRMMKRAKASDPVALEQMGGKCYHEGDYEGAFKYYTTAAELGDVEAHYSLSIMYTNGDGVEKDLKKQIYHLEEAAIAGHPGARFDLGCVEEENGRVWRAKDHFIIAANLGCQESTKALKDLYVDGDVSKEEYAYALRAYQAAVSATKSQQRDAAEEYKKLCQYEEEFNIFLRKMLTGYKSRRYTK